LPLWCGFRLHRPVISFVAVCGTFSGIHCTNKTNRRLQEERLRSEERDRNGEMLRSKGEELYALISTYFVDFKHATTTFSMRLLQTGRNVFAEHPDFNENNGRLLRIKMFVRVYFPRWESKVSGFDFCNRRLGSEIERLLKWSDKQDIEKIADGITGVGVMLGLVCENLQKSNPCRDAGTSCRRNPQTSRRALIKLPFNARRSL
jgi:hypothetical protein